MELINAKIILMDQRKILQFAKFGEIPSSKDQALSVGLRCTKAMNHKFLPWHVGLKPLHYVLLYGICRWELGEVPGFRRGHEGRVPMIGLVFL